MKKIINFFKTERPLVSDRVRIILNSNESDKLSNSIRNLKNGKTSSFLLSKNILNKINSK